MTVDTVPSLTKMAQDLPKHFGFMLEDHLAIILRCWLVGALVLALRFCGGWLYLHKIKSDFSEASVELHDRFNKIYKRLGFSGSVKLGISSHINTPLVVGFIRPLLLMPIGLVTSMDPVGIEALLVHELTHIRRCDYIVNVFQCVVEILLFYHPAVWLISRRVRTERELCCDDAAVDWCEDPLLYAETLTRLHELRSETLSPAIAANGGDLMFRIKRLLLPNLKPSTIPIRFNLLALACSLGLILGAGMSLNAMQARLAEDGKWFLAGSNKKDYVLSVDEKSAHGGKPSQTINCVSENPEGFGTIMQNFVPAEYVGKRVRMSAWVKTTNVKGWAGLWMRVDDAQNKMLAFDNMGKRPIKGTIDWKRFEVVLDVAQDAKNLAFGLLMDGPGQVWLNDLQFEAVDSSVAVTDTAGGPTTGLPRAMSSKNWFLAGSHPADYAMSLDPTILREGKPAHLLASKAEECKGFGTLMQMFKGMEFLGKRVRLTAWVKADNVTDWAGVWMRVDGPNDGSTAFDNMQPRPIKGSTDWKRYQIVLDVAPDSSAIALGILVSGIGKVWMAEPMLEVVDASVPVTDLNKK